MVEIRNSGIGTRVINFLIDTILIVLISYGVYYFFKWYAIYWHWPFIQYYIFLLGVQFLYYFIFESITGRTPGKMMSYTKVVTSIGGKPSVLKILIRSAIRLLIIDAFFYPFLNERTLHDYISDTNVIAVE